MLFVINSIKLYLTAFNSLRVQPSLLICSLYLSSRESDCQKSAIHSHGGAEIFPLVHTCGCTNRNFLQSIIWLKVYHYCIAYFHLSHVIFHINLTILAKSQVIPVIHSYNNLHELKTEVNYHKAKSRIQQEIYQVPSKKKMH